MLAIDYERMKEFIASSGLKQKVTVERAGLTEAQMSMILQPICCIDAFGFRRWL